MNMTCQKCNAQNQGGKFCDQCGTELNPAKCKKCGVIPARDDAKFCYYCGAPLGPSRDAPNLTVTGVSAKDGELTQNAT